MSALRSSQFMAALPAATRAALPKGFRQLRSAHRGWLCQLYPRDPQLHYEVWNMGPVRGKIELGLHFESRDHALNRQLLAGFDRRMVEIKATLGPQWEAEQWDRGWTKVYEVIPEESLTTDYQERVAARLVEMINCFQPILVGLRAAA